MNYYTLLASNFGIAISTLQAEPHI